MSFTTRCPACATMFRVVPDQLKISDGWVRCGHCSDVFDATLYLEPWTPPEAQGEADLPQGFPTSAPVETPVAAENLQLPEQGATFLDAAQPMVESLGDADEAHTIPAELPVAQAPPPRPPSAVTQPLPPADPSLSELVREDILIEEAADDWDSLVASDSGDTGSGSLPENRQLPPDPEFAEAGDFHDELKRFAAGTRGEPVQTVESEEAESERAPVLPAEIENKGIEAEQKSPAGTAEPRLPEHVDEPDEPGSDQADFPNNEPEFVRQARQRAFWQSPIMRALLSLLALVLLAALAGQWALHERDRLAARFPESVPLLTRACELLGCEVGAVHNIDAILIDSSTLARKLGNFYSFDLVLKNNAPLALAVPALELSLTDTRDVVISRRVFLPDELPGVPPLLPANGSVSVSLRLALNVGEDQPMAGYRALVFYP
jgi:predicted Zn finger-like uncharacterized protein